MLAEKYILLDSLLFQLKTIPGKETVLLAIPEVCADKIIYFISFKFVCRSSRSYKDISYN